MKRLFVLVLAGVFAAAQHLSAEGMGMGRSAPAYSQPTHPVSTTHVSDAALASQTSKKPSGPVHVSVSVAAEEKGTEAKTFPVKTPNLYGSFQSTGTNKGERIHAVWLNSSTKKPLYKTDMVSSESNFHGTVSITAPPTGWPAGKYELDIWLGNKLAGRTTFSMK